jgi:hypothetical protein
MGMALAPSMFHALDVERFSMTRFFMPMRSSGGDHPGCVVSRKPWTTRDNFHARALPDAATPVPGPVETFSAWARFSKNEEVEDLRLVREAPQSGKGGKSHVHGADLQGLDHLAVAAHLAVGKDLQRDRAAGILLEQYRELHRAQVFAPGFGDHVADAQDQRVAARAQVPEKSANSRATQATAEPCGQKPCLSCFHLSLPPS